MTGFESRHFEPLDMTALVFRTLTLYALAECQFGQATALILAARGNTFSVSDNGRGHSVGREIGGVPYLRFIYSHLDYPFSSLAGGAVQLQGLGMSLLNNLCSELHLTVRQPEETLVLAFKSGRLSEERRVPRANAERGNTLHGAVRSEFQPSPTAEAQLAEWLLRVQQANPGVTLCFNGAKVTGASDSAA